MFFIAVSRVAIALVGAFQFLVPQMAVFCTYLSSMVFSTASMAFYFFLILKKAYIKKGMWAKGFLGFAMPYLSIQILSYLLSTILCLASNYFKPILAELGYTLFYDPNEIYAIIAGGVILACYIGGTIWAYYWLRNKDKGAPIEPDIIIIKEKEEKVFEEFDI